MASEKSEIGVYPVGVLRDLRRARQEWVIFRNRRGAIRTFWYWFSRSWKRRSYWNGYLAEWHYPPAEMKHTRCGRGWTKRAAVRRLGIHIAKSNLEETP